MQDYGDWMEMVMDNVKGRGSGYKLHCDDGFCLSVFQGEMGAGIVFASTNRIMVINEL